MDQTTATILSLLDTRVKSLEALGKALTNALDNVLSKQDELDDLDLPALKDQVYEIQADVNRLVDEKYDA